MKTLVIILPLLIAGNLMHLLWIKARHRRWNKSVMRNEAGLMRHAAPFISGEGDTALLFIHGFADLPYSWKRVSRRLTETHDFVCHAMRVPRWGEPLKSQQGVQLREVREAIDAKITELSQQHGNIWLVGHSMGCAFAIDALPRNPDKVSGMATLAPLIRVSNRRVPILTARFWYYLGTKILWLARAFESPFTEKITAADDPDFSYAVDKFIPYSVYDILFSVTKSNRKVVIPAKIPIFCAISARDKVVDSATTRNWFARLRNPKRLYVDDLAAHTLHHGENWKEITDQLGIFIEKNNASRLPSRQAR